MGMTIISIRRSGAELWTLVAVLFLTALSSPSAEQDTDDSSAEVLEEFIKVPGMRMTEYNFWHSNETRVRCAEICLNETRIYCKSFSYSGGGHSCGIYGNGRSDAPVGIYGPQVIPLAETGDQANWIYYERKSNGYRLLEEQMKILENLTTIGLDFASEILTNLTHSLTIDDVTESSGDVTISSGELDLISKMLRVVLDVVFLAYLLYIGLTVITDQLKLSVKKIVTLNPVKNETPEVVEIFAQVLINVSDALMRPEHVIAWKALQQNPEDGSVADVMLTTDVAGRDISSRLLRFSNSTSITVESGGVGMWFDIVHFPQSTRPPLLGFSSLAADVMEKIARILNEHQERSYYTFPPQEKTARRPRRRKKTEIQNAASAGDDVIRLPTEALRNRSVVTHVRYKMLHDIISSQYVKDRYPKEDTTYSIISSILTTSVHPNPPEVIFKENPVTIIFKHDDQNILEEFTKPTPESSDTMTEGYTNRSWFPSNIQATQMCVFWKESDDSPGGWSKDGCVLESANTTHTVCECQHLTSFAVLLQMVDTSTSGPSMRAHTRALSYVSYIGCTLSLVGVTIMCAAFIMLRFHTENMKIHFNLGVAVGAADCIFIFEEFAQKERYSCVLVTILLYYTNMAVLTWMMIEGLFLYSQVVVVFVSARRWVRYYVLAGWGIPAIVMGLAMGILNVQLGKNRICWLSPADYSIWAFAAPAILVISVNFIILISVVRVIVGIQPVQGSGVKIGRVKNAVKGSIFLSPLLGTTWLFGLLSLSEETVVFQYLFAVLNSLQGFFLFLFHCVCNSEVRADIARRRNRKPATGGVFGGRATSWFSGTFGFNVASGLRKFRNSISFDFANLSHSTSENATEKESKYTPKRHSAESPSVEPSPKLSEENVSKRNEMKMEPRTISKILEEHPTHERNSKLPPLPLMPMKNDVILGGRNNKISPEGFQHTLRAKKRKGQSENRSFDRFHAKSRIQSPVDLRRKNPGSNMGIELPNCREREDSDIFYENAEPKGFNEMDYDVGREKEISAKNLRVKLDSDIAMSYDSGLNSIDNDSILDGEYANDEMPYGDCVFDVDGVQVVKSPAWKERRFEH